MTERRAAETTPLPVSAEFAAPSPEPSLAAWVLRGYSWKSLVALALIVLVGSSVGYSWSDLVDANGVDALLLGTWIWMTLMLCWRVTPRWDLLLLVSGLAGGGIIEWWGTTTQLWTYFTRERPPLWILPAWPIAAISIDRMALFYSAAWRRVERRRGATQQRAFRAIYWVCLPTFVVGMSWFLWPAIDKPASWAVVCIMLAVTLTPKDPRGDVMLFLAGTSLGVFLEYWGTSRQCWTYYTHQVPPPIAVVAHGFAALAFNRVAQAIAERLAIVAPALEAPGLGSPAPGLEALPGAASAE
ncbi:MAG: hypothetical protein R3B89_00235 [Polyangiaceae bacterium]